MMKVVLFIQLEVSGMCKYNFFDYELLFVFSESSIVERDCTLDKNYESNWCETEKGCEKCFESSCNTQNVRHSQCLRCQSDINGECNKITDLNHFIEQCDHSSYSYEDRGCYASIKGD